jgi:hypothetical protein
VVKSDTTDPLLEGRKNKQDAARGNNNQRVAAMQLVNSVLEFYEP